MAQSAPPAERERRRRPRGARRRAQLLTALEQLLAERPIEQIEIADVTKRAGVARSLFYFYFSGKGGAAAALVGDALESVVEAGGAWREQPGSEPRDRVRTGVDAMVTVWRAHARPLLALLDAIPGDPAAREQVAAWRGRFAEHARERIARDQRQGWVPAEVDPCAVAEVLTGMTVTAMERDVRALASTGEPLPGVIDALAHVWYRSLYV